MSQPFRFVISRLPRHGSGPFLFQLRTVDGVAPVAYQVLSGALPSGATLSTSGVLSYDGQLTGTFSFTLRATDAAAHTATLVCAWELFGASYQRIGLNVIPTSVVQAAERVGVLAADDARFHRHFAGLPDPGVADFAHFAEDVGVDMEGDDNVLSLLAVLRGLAARPLAVPTRFTGLTGAPYDTDPGRLAIELEPDAPLFFGADGLHPQAFRFFDPATDTEYTTGEDLRLRAIEVRAPDDTLLGTDNSVDVDGFLTGLLPDGTPIDPLSYLVIARVDSDDEDLWNDLGAGELEVQAALQTRLDALAPDVLLAAVRFCVAAEIKTQQSGATPLRTLNTWVPTAGGNFTLTPKNGLELTSTGLGTADLAFAGTIGGVGFSEDGEIGLIAGDHVTLTADVDAHTIRIDTNPGVRTLQGQGAVGNNFNLQSSDGRVFVAVSPGVIDLTLRIPAATSERTGLMTPAQAAALDELTAEAPTDLHRHDGKDVLMGMTVSATRGLFDFSAETSVVLMLQRINDYLKAHNDIPDVGQLTGLELTVDSGLTLVTGVVPADGLVPSLGLFYGVGYASGDVVARVGGVDDTEIVWEVEPFSDGGTGDLSVLLNGVEIDAVELDEVAGTYAGAEGIVSAVVALISGSLSFWQATVTLTVPVDLLHPGYNALRLSHIVPDEDPRDAQDYIFWYDAAPVAVSVTFTPQATVDQRRISGISYLTADADLVVAFSAPAAARNAAALLPLTIEVTGEDAVEVDWNDAATNWGAAGEPEAGAAFAATAFALPVAAGDLPEDFVITLTPRSPTAGDGTPVLYTDNTTGRYLRVPTAVAEPTTSQESFFDETYRTASADWSEYATFPSASGPSGDVQLYGWDAARSVLAMAALWGETMAAAQVVPGGLVYPAIDYLEAPACVPAQVLDYSGTTVAAAIYDRYFLTTVAGHKQVRIRIYGITAGDLGLSWHGNSHIPGGNVNVELKRPTGVWIDAYKVSTGVFTTDGAGGRLSGVSTGTDGFGSYVELKTAVGAATVGVGLVVRLTLRDPGVTITRLQIYSAAGGAF